MSAILTLDHVLRGLNNVQPSGSDYSARCPAHDDRENSLSVSESDHGRVLLYCHAGCGFEEVTRAIQASLEGRTCRNDRGDEELAADRGEPTGLTLETYAREKHLPAEFLRKLGLRTVRLRERTAVRIPYFDENLRKVTVRFRFAMNGRGRFAWLKGSRLHLYGRWRLERMRKAGYIVLAEGESDCHTLWLNRFPALGLPGANSWREEWGTVLAGVPVIYIVIEPDRGGEAILRWLAKSQIRDRARLLRLNGAKDPSDLYLSDPKNFPATFKKALEVALAWKADAGAEGRAHAGTGGRGTSQATRLVALAANAELFHSAEGRAYAAIPVGQHVETWAVRSTQFRCWLATRFHEIEKRAPSFQALQDAFGVVEGKALYEGKEEMLSVRVAEQGGKIYLDLCDSRWRAVEITADGWQIVNSPPVRFRRARGMLALPEPANEGAIKPLWPFLNLGSNRDWILAAAWLVAALRGRGPYPILALQGGQGTAKTTTQRVLRRLIDPNVSDLRTPPRDERDLMIAARNSLIISFDNVSYLPQWLSDGLCRLATGGGFATRELYSDDEEILFDAMRPIMLNGIEEVATRSDLLERSITLDLPEIREEQRVPEKRFWANYERMRPLILGALLSIVSSALREFPSVELAKYPRMADFAEWATAAERSLGLKRGAFLVAYSTNQEAMNALALEASPVAAMVLAFAEVNSPWEGTASELLEELDGQGGFHHRSEKAWPKTPRALSNALRRVSKNLRAVGIGVTFRREARRRIVHIEKLKIP